MKKFVPVIALLGGLLLIFGNRLPDVDFGNLFPVVISEPIEGSTLYLVHEKQYPTADHVLDVRRAPEFVSEHKLSGFRDMDDDEETLVPVLKEIQDKYKLEPPLLIAQDDSPGKSRIIRVRKWENGLEDILK